MSTIISGLIGLILVFTFLGYYAFRLKSIPLWIIIVGILVMISVEFYESAFKNPTDENEKGE
ncbi:MAG: hypothetical protein V3V56_01050 [bacterium]